jgi:voltage-gated potassium channel
VAAPAKLTRHIQLLAALVAMELLNPLLAKEQLTTRILSVAVFATVCVAVFRAVFDTTPQRWTGTILAGSAVVLNFARLLVPEELHLPTDVAIDVFAAALYAFVLAVIVSHMFGARQLRSDDVIGAFSGYILIALIWGRLYALVWLATPGSYRISPDVTWQLGNWHTLHALFDYYSFTTISSIGYADITTTGPASNTLVWLEVMCGQFYLAVVVASIVGMRLAQTLAPPRDGS